MEADFWHRRWHKNEIGFHETDGSRLLKTFFSKLKLSQGARVFVPLCGKTRDIAWLLAQGYDVVGIELNESAVIQLFQELGLSPKATKVNDSEPLAHFLHTFENGLTIDIYQGDFFVLNKQSLGAIDAVYDRAALVALPEEMRVGYTQHLQSITAGCQQLLISFHYADGVLKGPPHSVSEAEITRHYQSQYAVEPLYYEKIEGGFRGQATVFETAYYLQPLHKE